MKKVLITLMVFMFIPSLSHSYYDESVLARELYFFNVLANDYKQTIDITKTRRSFENNKILGKHPGREKVNTYFISCAVGHALITYLLPEKLTKIWQLTWIGIQSNQINMNNNSSYLVQRMGMSYRFKYTIEF